MGDLAATKDRVQRILTEMLGTVEIDQQGRYTFRHGSARVFVKVTTAFEDATVVTVSAPTNFKVPPSLELFRHLCVEDHYFFGSFKAFEDDEGVLVVFEHSILGDYLDPEELKYAVGAVASTADEVDDEIQAKFGGDRFHED